MLESVAFKSEAQALESFASLSFVKECVVVQTCNRVEVYLALDEYADAVASLTRSWSRAVGVSEDIVRQVAEVYQGREAILHLLQLASGLKSMVVGEDQILGQVRKALVASKKAGTAGLILEKVFMKAVNVGRRIRTETSINEGSVSISSVAVDLAEKNFGGFASVRAFVVGAGEAGTLIAEELSRRKVGRLIVTNRTYERGCELAAKVDGTAVKFEEVYEVLPSVDLAFVAINTDKPFLKVDELENALRNRRGEGSLFILDISQPRAVEEEAASLSNVVLKNIDDLRGIVEENLQKRRNEAQRAEQIIGEELGRLEEQLGRILAEPLVSRIYQKVEGIREKELRKALQMMRGLDEKQRVVVEDLTRELVERILQVPAERLREAALDNDGSLLSAAEKLFYLKEHEKR
jgi:glutamyl-tRNA reductase